MPVDRVLYERVLSTLLAVLAASNKPGGWINVSVFTEQDLLRLEIRTSMKIPDPTCHRGSEARGEFALLEELRGLYGSVLRVVHHPTKGSLFRLDFDDPAATVCRKLYQAC